MARGTVRRAFSISSPIVDPLSTPPKANASVDQKMMSLRCMLGTTAWASIGVADPNRLQATAPSAISSIAGSQPASAPTLVSHFPTFNPTTFIATVTARPVMETATK